MPALCTQTLAAMPGLRCRARALRRRTRGFTLIELIMVVIILGVLAVFAAPRIFNSSGFYARGFQDETMALLRYAQKSAVAQRRTVCVTVSKSAPAWLMLSVANSEASSNCNTSLIGPNLNTQAGKDCAGAAASTGPDPRACIFARPGISYATGPTSLTFNGLGQPSSGVTFQIADASGTVTGSVTVEAETGYVHN